MMKVRSLARAVVSLPALVLLGSTVFSCSSEQPDEYEGPKDPCRYESSGCGADMLHFYLSEVLPDGEYEFTVLGDGETEVCTVVRSGTNDVDVPIFSVDCENDAFESEVSIDRYGFSIFGYRPEMITLTIENVDTGCSVQLTESPSYEATWVECGETCIDAFLDFDVSELLTSDSCEGMGGMGGMGGAN